VPIDEKNRDHLGAMPAIQDKWDRIYGSKALEAEAWPRVLGENAHLLPAHGRALDVACGMGGASIFLARHGLEVVAWDISPVAIARLRGFVAQHGLAITPEVVDVTGVRMPEQAFDVIHVSRFLERGVCAALSRALRHDGLLFYQTFSLEALDTAPHKNPDYCLVRGELLGLFHELRPVVYREDALLGDTAQGLRNEVLLVAQRPSPPPPFFVDWVRRVTDGDDPAALSRAIERHRRRLGTLADRLGPLAAGDAATREKEWGLLENDEVVIVPDACVPKLQALVILKHHYLLPTDMPEAALRRLGYMVDAIADAFYRVTGVSRCRCWMPHPDACKTRRLHLFVDPDVPIMDLEEKRTVWAEVSARVQQAIAAPLA
jgi:SAM-dependent methyltransferase